MMITMQPVQHMAVYEYIFFSLRRQDNNDLEIIYGSKTDLEFLEDSRNVLLGLTNRYFSKENHSLIPEP